MPTSKAISIEEIKKRAKGTLVEIPDWEPGKFISVRLKTIDITPLLMETGSIPDQLSPEVADMFEKTGEISPTSNMDLTKFVPMLDAMAKSALVEPTYEEINEIYPLTLTQKLAIFQYITGGIDQMKPFRKE